MLMNSVLQYQGATAKLRTPTPFRRSDLQRRQLLAMPLLALAAAPGSADELFIEYSREIYEEALASGEPFMLDFYASW